MKKKLTLLIYLLPILLMGQNISKNGTISFDLGKKNQQQTDTVPKQSPYYSDDDGDAPPQKKQKTQKPVPAAPVVKKQDNGPQKPDFRNDGLFKGLFTVGINGCQIDGDGYGGYNYPGLDAAVGAMVQFHKFLSATMQIEYSQEGAKQAFVFNDAATSLQEYRVEWDYIRVPVSLNVTSTKWIMINIGLSPGIMVRFNERDQDGDNVTNPSPIAPNGPPEGYPRIFDLAAFGGLYFIIHRNYMLGGQYSYSLLKIRGPQFPGVSHLNGEFNNVISLRFSYILDPVKKKKG